MRKTVADGLPNVEEGAGNGLQLRADLRKDDFARSAAFVKLDVELIHAHRHDMIVFFGASGASSDTFHPINGL